MNVLALFSQPPSRERGACHQEQPTASSHVNTSILLRSQKPCFASVHAKIKDLVKDRSRRIGSAAVTIIIVVMIPTLILIQNKMMGAD